MAKKGFSKSRKYSKYKVNNWREYTESLRRRGDIEFMIADNLSECWYEDRCLYRKRGGQRRYSDKAILMCLQIRYLFGLKLRQTEGFINWIFRTAGLPLACPDYTTLSKRGKELNLKTFHKTCNEKFDYVSMDSTGIQVHTGNEWLENKHGRQYTRKIWKKLHIVVDDEGNILANSTTDHNKNDRSQVEVLLENIDAKEMLADPGYDSEDIYQILIHRDIKPVIRPPNSAPAVNTATERQKAASYQHTRGYHAWRVKNNYGRRELVENTFFRFKNTFSGKFSSRNIENMQNEMTIKCQLLNKMFEVGKPDSRLVA